MLARTLSVARAGDPLPTFKKNHFARRKNLRRLAGSSGDLRILAEPCGDFAEPRGALRRLAETSRSLAELCGDFAEPCGALRRLRGALRSFAETCATINLLADDVNCTSRLP